jgi:anti-sigma factor RsiW
MTPEQVSETEIDAYVDGELDMARRLAVEDWLARHPAEATRVMADLRTRTGLRLLCEGEGAVPPASLAAADRLSRRLRQANRPKRRWATPRRVTLAGVGGSIAAALALLPTPTVMAAPPAYVADAVQGYQTALLRAGMRSQATSRDFDRSEVQRRTNIRVPRLPNGWEITDVQIFPSDEGPALQIMIRTQDRQDISIFAVRADSRAPQSPEAIRHGSTSVAYWRQHDISYALIGAEAPEALDVAAEDFADNQTD